MSTIIINFQDTIRKANQLEKLAEDIRYICDNDFAEINNHCAVVWKGNAGNAYRKKFDQISAKLKKRANNLKTTADSIERTAECLKRVEELACSIFSS